MGDGRGDVPLLEEHAPDLLVLDLGLPLLNGLNILRKIRDRGFSGQAVIRSVRKDDAYVSEVFDWGVLGYVLKGGGRGRDRRCASRRGLIPDPPLLEDDGEMPDRESESGEAFSVRPMRRPSAAEGAAVFSSERFPQTP